MPRKNPNTERFGGPGSSKQDRNHPEKFHKSEGPRPGQPPAVGNRRFPAGGVSGKDHRMILKYKSRWQKKRKWSSCRLKMSARMLTDAADGLPRVNTREC